MHVHSIICRAVRTQYHIAVSRAAQWLSFGWIASHITDWRQMTFIESKIKICIWKLQTPNFIKVKSNSILNSKIFINFNLIFYDQTGPVENREFIDKMEIFFIIFVYFFVFILTVDSIDFLPLTQLTKICHYLQDYILIIFFSCMIS